MEILSNQQNPPPLPPTFKSYSQGQQPQQLNISHLEAGL